MWTIVYDQRGNLQGVIFANSDGSTSSGSLGSKLYEMYVAANGVPSPTGAPTYPAAPPSADEISFQTLVSKALGAGLQASDVLSLLTLAVKTGRLK